MPTIKFEIPGMPQGKGRPKFANRGTFVTAYTPKKTREYEALITEAYIERLNNLGLHPNQIGQDAFNMDVIANFNVPESASKKENARLLQEQVHAKKPDIDNIVKVILDALNEVAFNDDSQLVFLTASKRYTSKPASVEVVFTWEEDESIN